MNLQTQAATTGWRSDYQIGLDDGRSESAAKITELQSQVDALRKDAERLKEIETSHEYKVGLAVNRAAGNLPEGFYIEIFLENGCGEVQLFNHERKKVVFEQDDMYFYEQIGAAIDAAIKGEQAA